tara:strand:+ start:37 stop:450 length:414 start_codon:yes stop_codon:yes gene_type:complete
MKCININVIFTYDNKDQDTIDLFMREDEFAFNLRNEVAFVKWVINKSFSPRDIEEANDLLKISMCIRPENISNKEFTKWTGIKEFLARGGKYYFQPNQRDKVENLIIKDTNIASETKPFNKLLADMKRLKLKVQKIN